MPHHFTKNTLDVTRWCNHCKLNTQWSVWDGRLGRCKEDHHKAKPAQNQGAAAAATAVAVQGSLFDDTATG